MSYNQDELEKSYDQGFVHGIIMGFILIACGIGIYLIKFAG